MHEFSALFHDLDGMTKTNDRIDRLAKYFKESDSVDAAWACWFLCGNRIKGAVKVMELRGFAAEKSGLPLWLVEECHERVGDLAETLSLLITTHDKHRSLTLFQVVEKFLLPLVKCDSDDRRELVFEAWKILREVDLLPFHKLLTGGFRIGVSKSNLCKALAKVAEVEPAIIAQRLAGNWNPENLPFEEIVGLEKPGESLCRPYPFCLAYPLQVDLPELGSSSDWLVEWKWDGIRAQLLSGQGSGMLWSRGDESIGDSFPELLEFLPHLPADFCMDGEVLAWGHEGLRPFSRLQKRLGRKDPLPSFIKKNPVRFIAYDLLRLDGVDLRPRPFSERREILEKVIGFAHDGLPLGISSVVEGKSWNDFSLKREESRTRGVEGFMLKRKNAPYETGRVKGAWYKWKVDPFVADMVVVSAQLGHGKRASLYTDYGLAVWTDSKELVTVAKAYSGLTDREIKEIDSFVRKNITGKFGPVRSVRPELVFEIAFEGVRASGRHKSGVALRFPRINRWRKDKKPEEADSLETIRGLARIDTNEDPNGIKTDSSGNLLLF